MKKFLVLFLPFLLLPLFGWSQIWSVLPGSTAKNGTLTATAYDWEVIGVNPANLGWNINHFYSFTFLDVGVSGQSKDMSFSNLMAAIHSKDIVTSSNSWQNLMGHTGGLNVNADINWAAVSFHLLRVPGGFAANIRDRISGNGYLGPNGSEALIVRDSRVYSDPVVLSLLNGTSLRYMHYREINLDYGLPLFNLTGSRNSESPDIARCFSFNKKDAYGYDGFALYGGIGIKYLMGLAYINGDVSNGINATYSVANKYPMSLGGPGHGLGVDLGLSALWKCWKFGLSATDIGYINWKHTLVTTGDTDVAAIIHGSDFIGQLKNGTLTGSQNASDAVTALPAKLRMGAGYQLNNRILLSSDIILPLNKSPYNITSPYLALGAQANLHRYVTLFAGLDYTSNYGLGLPIGATFNATQHVSFYLGTTDVTGYLGKKNNANVSLALWAFRYNF